MTPSWISDQNNLSFLYLQVTLTLPTKFGVNWPLGLGEEVKNSFLRWQSWWPSWISNQNDFSYFDQLITLMLPIKFQDNRSLISREEAENRFSRWRPWRPF